MECVSSRAVPIKRFAGSKKDFSQVGFETKPATIILEP
jgi:hypothetical protein